MASLLIVIVVFYASLTAWLIWKKLHILPPKAETFKPEPPEVLINGKRIDKVNEFYYFTDGIHVNYSAVKGDFIRWKAKRDIDFNIKISYPDWHYSFLDYTLKHINLETGGTIELVFVKEK